MKIYIISLDKSKCSETRMEEFDLDKILSYPQKGNSIVDKWDPTMKIYLEKNVCSSDVLLFNCGLFTVSDKVADVIEKLIPDKIERLSIEQEGFDKHYCVINPISVVDCIDMEKSKYKVYPGRKDKIQTFKEIHIKKGSIQGEHLFRAQRCNHDLFFCSEELKNALDNCGTVGFKYDYVEEI